MYDPARYIDLFDYASATVVCGPQANQLCKPNNNRIGLYLAAGQGNAVSIGPFPNPSLSFFMWQLTNGQTANVTWGRDGFLSTLPFWGIVQAATTPVTVIEVFFYGDRRT